MTQTRSKPKGTRSLVLVLGDQLDRHSAAFDGFDPATDVVWMAEAQQEAEHVWSAKPRLVMFFSAMRHFREALGRRGIRVFYRRLEDPDNAGSLANELERSVRQLRPKRIILVEPGEHRIKASLTRSVRQLGAELAIRPDRSFLCSHEQFAAHAAGRKQLRQEFFYRQMRKRLGVLMEDDRPAGGKWNYDAENRRRFGPAGPGDVRAPRSFRPDRITGEVIAMVRDRFVDHPGRLDCFDWPVTPAQAQAALKDFVANRLVSFGPFQDAMWAGRPFLYHSRLSAAMNLKLLDPRKVIAAAEQACLEGQAPSNSVEGFIRQVLGWREYVRGVYWRFMPGYLARNALEAQLELPPLYWTGQTDANCLREVITQTLERGFAHHIQRLMVTGLFALLVGVRPQEVHKWYLAVYVDAVEWVELPNTLGMSQFGDDGIMASKPYAASGKYIRRMSNYCRGCRYDPARATGQAACPFTTLYWDFLMRHEKKLERNPRAALQIRNLRCLGATDRGQIRNQAGSVRNAIYS